MIQKKYALALAVAIVLGAGSATAGDVRMYQSGEVPEASEVANILSGGKSTKGPKMRGISLTSVKQPEVQKAPDLEQVAQPSNSVIGLPIEFAFNSAEILPSNEPQLDAVAQGIKMTDGVRVLVEGHTDASGSDTYNNWLSLKRAEAVRSYLMDRHGISASLLLVEGRGEQMPLNAADPFAAENRRVQLRAAN